MNAFASCAYEGTVVHKRVTPRAHAFRYRVFALALDVDEIAEAARRLRLFSRGAWNLLSFHDRDVGAGDGTPAGDGARALLRRGGLEAFGARITLLTYPRILGYVFNPLSVYFCRDGEGRLGAIIYEVTNTFRERRSYVIPVEATDAADGALVAQSCGKEMYVSPFTAPEAEYGFHVLPPGERVVVGVSLREAGRAVLRTHFEGRRVPLGDGALAGLLLRHPLMTAKVVAAIHVEAARLWLKGVPLVARHASPPYAATITAAQAKRPAE